MARNYTAIPHGYLEECEMLSDAEFGRLIRALLRYSIYGEVIETGGNEAFFAKRLMMQEDRYRARFDEISRRRAEAGRQGAAKRWGGADADGNCHDIDK